MIAAEPIPFGLPVMATEAGYRCATRATMTGIAKRPRWAMKQTRYEIGEEVVEHTDGTILAEIEGETEMVEVRKGKIA